MKIKYSDSRNEYRVLINNVLLDYSKRILSVPTQQYYNSAYMEETFHDLTTKIRQRKKSMKYTDKDYVEGYFNFKKYGSNNMHTFFYSNISEVSGNLEGTFDDGTYKTAIHNMHKLGWKAQLLKYAGVSMLGHGCVVSQYPQFYDRIKNIYQMLPHPYVGSYSGEKGHQFLQEPWINALSKSFETFFMVSISDMPTSQYWKFLGSFMDKSKENITKQCIIGDTCFTSLATIGGKLFTRHPKNLNHVQKYSNDLLSVIIILGTNVHGTVFL